MAQASVDPDAFVARLLDAHAQQREAELVALVEAVGVVRVVRWLRKASCPEGPTIVATLVRQKRAWHRDLVRAGAANALVTAIERSTKRQRHAETKGERDVECPQQLRKQKTHESDEVRIVDALRCLSPAIETKLRSVVNAMVSAYKGGTAETKRVALESLRGLLVKPQTKPMMLKAGVIALCVDALDRVDENSSWNLAIDILVQLNGKTPPGILDSDVEDQTENDDDSDPDSEQEDPCCGEALAIQALLKGGHGEQLCADEPRSLAHVFELAPGSPGTKMKKLKQLISRNASAKRAMNQLIPTLVLFLTLGTENEQLAASRTIIALIDGCKRNAPAAIRAGVVDGFLHMFNTHTDVVSVVNVMELFVRRLQAIRSQEARDALESVLIELLGAAQDPSNDQGAVAIELLCLLSTTRSLCRALVDAGAIRVCRDALDRIMETRTYDGAIQLRHVTTMLINMGKGSVKCDELIEQGVLDNLIFLLKRAPSGSRSDITLALSQLAASKPAKTVMGSSGCLAIFVHMLCSSVDREHTAAAGALASACSECPTNVTLIRHTDVIDRCVQWLRAKSETTYEPALRLLAVLTADDKSRPSVVNHNVSSLVVCALVHGSLTAKCYAANIVEELVGDRFSWAELMEHGVHASLITLARDSRARGAAIAALRSINEHSFNTWPATASHKGSFWFERVSLTPGGVFYSNLLTENTHYWAASMAPEIDILTEQVDVVHPAFLIHALRAAGGVRPLLKILSAVDRCDAVQGTIVDLLRQLANEHETAKLVIGANLGIFSRLVCHGTRAEQTAAANAIVEIFPATEWITDEATRTGVIDACVHQFMTEESSSLAAKYATLVVTKLEGLDAIEADTAIANFFRGLLTIAKSRTDARATLAIQLLVPWFESSQLAQATADAGVPALCVSILEQLSTATVQPRCGAFELVYAKQIAGALITNGLGEKLVEEGMLELLVSLFETFHQPPESLAADMARRGVREMDWLGYALLRQSTPGNVATDVALLQEFGHGIKMHPGHVWRTHLAHITDLLLQLARNLPHTRVVIGESSCIKTLVALIDHPAADCIGADRSHYVNLLATACIHCPENTRQVPHQKLINVCVEILERGYAVREAKAALSLVYSLALDENTGPDIATNHELVDAVVDALRSESQVRSSKSTKWVAARVVEALVRYTPSRMRLVEAGVEDVLKATTQNDVVHPDAKKALRSLHNEQRKVVQLDREASERESEGFIMVHKRDGLNFEADENLRSLLATIDDAESDDERVEAVKIILAFIGGSGSRAVPFVNAGLVDAILRVFTTTATTDKAAKSMIQKCLYGLHTIIDQSNVTRDAKVQIVRGVFDFTRASMTDRGELALGLLCSWATVPTLHDTFEASGISASCLNWIKETLALDIDTLPSAEWQLLDAVELLASLVKSDQIRDTLIDSGATPLLLTVLSKIPRGERLNLLSILHELALHDAAMRPQLTTHLDTLVTIMRSGTKEDHERVVATNLLAVVCTECPAYVQHLLCGSLLEQCVAMLDKGVSLTQQAALRVVKSLCADPVAARTVAAHAELVEIVQRRRQRTPPLTQQLATDVALMLTQLGVTRLQLDEETTLGDSSVTTDETT